MSSLKSGDIQVVEFSRVELLSRVEWATQLKVGGKNDSFLLFAVVQSARQIVATACKPLAHSIMQPE